MGGATERPTPEHVFRQGARALEESASGADLKDASLDTNPELDSRGIPWPIFVSLLVANGWFLNARPFRYITGGPATTKRLKRALLRIPFFLAGWGIAFAALPSAWVGAALVAWGAWITPKVRFINREFQNIPKEV
jgi:hypothetical protein